MSSCGYKGKVLDIQNNAVHFGETEKKLVEEDDTSLSSYFAPAYGDLVQLVPNINSPLNGSPTGVMEGFKQDKKNADADEKHAPEPVRPKQSLWKQFLYLAILLAVLFIAVYITVYRYILVGSAIEHGQSGLAVALLTPEIGQGLGSILTSLSATSLL